MSGLTPREQEVCILVATGKMNEEIAAFLGISPRTVEDHRHNVYRKLKVRNVVELILLVYGVETQKIDKLIANLRKL